MRHVLLLADNKDEFRETWGALLMNEGYQVKLASGAAEVRMILEKTGVDLAILDLRLEDDDDRNDISGLDIALDKRFRQIPKVILTAYQTTYQDLRTALGLTVEQLPPVAALVGKDEGSEALLHVVRNTLETWPRLRMSTSRVSEQIKSDHTIARQQASVNYVTAVIFSILGFLLIVTSILLAWGARLEIGVAGTTSGILLEVIGYLFFKQVEAANARMDVYHRELLQTYWLELLVATCEQLPFEREVAAVETVIKAAVASWLAPQTKRLPATVEQNETRRGGI